MIATAGTQYEYNATGERVSKDNASGVPQTLYLHDGDGNQIAELNAALTVQHVNVYSGKHLVGTWNPASGKVYYAYSDWLPGSPTTGLRRWGGLGTKRYEADGAGTYVNSWASLPFGDNQTALGTGPDATEHHFTGQEHDAESGLDHFAARYYQSQTGRWLLPDWSATPVPVPYATFTNPQSLNLYTYVGNNPVNAVDADGHEPPGGGNQTNESQAIKEHEQRCAHGEADDACNETDGNWTNDTGDGAVKNASKEATQANNDMKAQKKTGPPDHVVRTGKHVYKTPHRLKNGTYFEGTIYRYKVVDAKNNIVHGPMDVLENISPTSQTQDLPKATGAETTNGQIKDAVGYAAASPESFPKNYLNVVNQSFIVTWNGSSSLLSTTIQQTISSDLNGNVTGVAHTTEP